MADPKLKGKRFKTFNMPLLNEQVYKETRKAINALNKARSRAMETKIAKYLTVDTLDTSRTPMSGAMKQYKGDCIGYYSGGKFMVECKLTQAQDKDEIPILKIEQAWLAKMHEEAKSIRAKFAVLIVHFVHKKYEDNFVFIHHADAARFTHPVISRALFTPHTYDIRYRTSGSHKNIFSIQSMSFRNSNIVIDSLHHQNIMTTYGLYLVVSLRDFRDILIYEGQSRE